MVTKGGLSRDIRDTSPSGSAATEPSVSSRARLDYVRNSLRRFRFISFWFRWLFGARPFVGPGALEPDRADASQRRRPLRLSVVSTVVYALVEFATIVLARAPAQVVPASWQAAE